jgi:hypothetical protein
MAPPLAADCEMTREIFDDVTDMTFGFEDEEPIFSFDAYTEADFFVETECQALSGERLLAQLEIWVSDPEETLVPGSFSPQQVIEHDFSIDDDLVEDEAVDDYGNPIGDSRDEDIDWSEDSYDREFSNFDREADLADFFEGVED